jgi:hypothetical protein
MGINKIIAIKEIIEMITFNEYKTYRELVNFIAACDIDPNQLCENIVEAAKTYGPEGLTDTVLDEIWNPFSKIAQGVSGAANVAAAPLKWGARAAGRGAMSGAEALGRGAQRGAEALGRGAQRGAEALGRGAQAIGRGAHRGAEAVGGAVKGAAGAVGEKWQQGVQAQQIAQAKDRINGLQMSMQDLGIAPIMAQKVAGQIADYMAKKTGLDPEQFLSA